MRTETRSQSKQSFMPNKTAETRRGKKIRVCKPEEFLAVICPHLFMWKSVEMKSDKELSQTDQQCVGHPYDGVLLSHRKERSPTHATPWTNPENIMQGKRSQTSKVTYLWLHL